MLCTPNHLAKGHNDASLLRDKREFQLKRYLIMCLVISCSNHNSIFKLKRSDAFIYLNILI